MSSPVAIGISGKLGGGKSSVAAQLADSLRCPLASFGDFVRRRARADGMAERREALQELGAALLETLGPREFATQVLETSGWASGQSVVVEGVRHPEIAMALKEIVLPIRFCLVYLDVPEADRLTRLAARDGLDPEEVDRLDRHSTEIGVTQDVKRMADHVIDAGRDLTVVANDILRRLDQI